MGGMVFSRYGSFAYYGTEIAPVKNALDPISADFKDQYTGWIIDSTNQLL